ncbi:hypothetical protein LINPERHAP1_LOCUS28951 [Linum perenne]
MKINIITSIAFMVLVLFVVDGGRHLCVADQYVDCMNWCLRNVVGVDPPSLIGIVCERTCKGKLSDSSITEKLKDASTIH